MNFPVELRYTAEHIWVRSMDDGAWLIGITDFAQQQLGKIIFVDLPAVGRQLQAGREMGAVESAKSVSDLFAPINGVVLMVNAAAEATPDLINREPYGGGWLISLTQEAGADLEHLLQAEQYRKLVLSI